MKKLFLFLTLLFVGVTANAQYTPYNNLNYMKLLKVPPVGAVEDSVLVYDGSDSFVKMRPSSELVPEHNSLSGLQGGATGEYNHLTNAQVALVNSSEQTTNKSDSYTVSSTTTYPNTKALVDGLATKQNTLTNPITGSGTTNYVSKFTGTTSLGNSGLFDNGTNLGFGTTAPQNFSGYKTFTLDGVNGGVINLRVNGTNSLRFYPQADGSYMAENRSLPIIFYTNGSEGMRLNSNQELLIGTSTSNASKLRVNGSGWFDGNLTATSYSGGATLTGTPTAPTATAGTNTTQIATTAFVDSALIQKGQITTSTSITNATLTDASLPQEGKVVYISNGANNINYTVNGEITASFIKGGTGSISFVQGSGRTLVAANGTLIFNGAQYSTASISSFGTTDILYINNF